MVTIAAAWCAGFGHGIAQDPDSTAVAGRGMELDVPRSATSAEQLRLARAWVLRARHLRAASTAPEALRRALRACAVVEEAFPGEPAACAEAAFRSAQLLRAHGERERALTALAHARERGRGTPWAARAWLECASVLRRSGDRAGARTALLRATQEHVLLPRQRRAAWYALGRIHLEEGRFDEARAAWEWIAGCDGSPLDRLRAFDAIGRSWLEQGELEAAAGTLHRLRVELAPALAERTRTGARLRAAVGRLVLESTLERAIRER
jgi:tetratricopeptide (TPR) repeat protein